jgi:SlyX protein
MPQEKEHADRIAELEAKSALADDLLDELNRTVFRQQQQIEQLARDLQAVRERLRDLAVATPAAADPGDEVPPHY